jgi:hypothetical protein
VRLFTVRLGSRVIAASFTLSDGRIVHVPWAASLWKYRASNPNMLLYWTMLADAADRRAITFDFGRSTRDSGTWQFKRQWGPAERPLHWHYLLENGKALPDQRPDSPRYRLMVACWKRLPVGLARRLGPPIIGKLS